MPPFARPVLRSNHNKLLGKNLNLCKIEFDFPVYILEETILDTTLVTVTPSFLTESFITGMVIVVSIITAVLMAYLTVRIYQDKESPRKASVEQE